MRFFRLFIAGFLGLLLTGAGWVSHAQSIPVAPAELEFAGIPVQLTPLSRQRLQQSLNALYGDRNLLLSRLETLNQLRPLLDQRLTDQRVPLDFRYACPPFTESPYDPFAYWGLDQRQAGQLRLVINQSVDGRRHVLIATDAVLPYLNLLHQQKGHWIGALFQYLDPFVKLVPAGSGPAPWLLDSHTPTAMWTILARKIAFEHEQALLRLTTPFVLLEYNQGAGKTLAAIAAQLNINTDRLSPYNSWLLADRVPATGNFPVILRLTLEEYLTVKAKLATSPPRSAANTTAVPGDLGFPVLRRVSPTGQRQTAILYQINGLRGIQAQLCDNAITLAYYGKISVPAFLVINDLVLPDILQPGQVYYLERKAKRAPIPFHVVQPGQTLRDISNLYGVRLKSLLRFNRLKASQRVQAGRLIWMQHRRPARKPVEYQLPVPARDRPAPVPDEPPPPADSVAVTPPASVTPAKPVTVTVAASRPDSGQARPPVVVSRPKPVTQPAPVRVPESTVALKHVVRAGQTYYSIAQLYKITITQLLAWNNLTVNTPLQIGQILRIESLRVAVPRAAPPVRREPPVPSPAEKPVNPTPVLPRQVQYYVVKPGETLYRIALNHGVSVPEMMRWNGLKDFTIAVGQRLIISPPVR